MHEKVRLDKWLWAARFYKTRSIAVTAIDAGHVNLNGQRTKPARMIQQGDILKIHTDHGNFEVTVMQLSEQRRGADIAQSLYLESEVSKEKRQRDQYAKALQPQFDHPQVKGRPTKKWRRQLNAFEQADVNT